MKPTKEGFLTDLDMATRFYEICGKFNLTSKEDRVWLLRTMVKLKQARYIRDVEEFVAQRLKEKR